MDGYFSIKRSIENDLARLTGNEWKVYGVLSIHADGQGQSWPSLRTIATKSGMTVVQARRSLQGLAHKGLITIEHRKAQAQQYRSNFYTVKRYFVMGNSDQHPQQLAFSFAEGGMSAPVTTRFEPKADIRMSASPPDLKLREPHTLTNPIEQEPRRLPPTPTAPPADSGRRTTPSDLSDTKKWTPIPPVVHRLEEELGYKLAHPVREARAVHRALALGYTEDQILACWRVLRQGYWRGRYLPLTVVLDNLGEFVAGRLQLEAQEDGRSGTTKYGPAKVGSYVEARRVEEFPANARDW